MKTINQINGEIHRLATEKALAESANNKRKVSRLSGEIEQLKFYKLYLETNPREKTVIKMRDDTARNIKILEGRFEMWLAGKTGERGALRARYESQVGLGELKHRLKALNYLCE
jgi:hypothetical protein